MGYKVDFATFVYAGDAHRLHQSGQLKKQVESNRWDFNEVIVVHQLCNPLDYSNPLFPDCSFNIKCPIIEDVDRVLKSFNIDLDKPQYKSETDGHHFWKPHVVNHLKAISETSAEFIVFADSDCWMIKNEGSWVKHAIDMLIANPRNIFLVSPNDGERSRMTRRMSQQMFMVRVADFLLMNFNQPGWDGNVNIPGGPFPEYHSLLEGRMEYYCKYINRFRYVCPDKFRYWHHNSFNEDGSFKQNYSDFGVVPDV